MDLERAYGYEVYPKRDITIVRGEGALLWDDQGNKYVDCASGIGVASVGHANPEVARAITEQAQKLITCPGIFYNDVRGQLMEKLVAITPSSLNRVFLCNSGTEAMEAALKFARNTTGKNGFVSAMRGFHGRTMGALSATFKYRDQFEPLLPGHRFVPFNNPAKLDEALDESIAAIVLEVVQGEGGVRPGAPGYFKHVQKTCDERGILLIIDEVQTGFARTGKMFACEHVDISPDIMTLAKAMAGGVPMGAVLCSDKIKSSLGKHGSTFGGNPLACAAALAAIDFIEKNHLATQAESRGRYLAEKLEKSCPASVREIRQQGLMIGIELKTRAKPVLSKLLEKHVLALPAGPTVIRLLPPLVVSEVQLDRVCDVLLEVLS